MQTAESTNPKDKFGKLKVSLTAIPPAAKVHFALAMMDGAGKYGPYNWRTKTVSARVYLDACQRHLDAYFDGEQNAPDSKVHHLGHAMACLGIIVDAEATGKLVDDRPPPGAAARLLAEFTKRMGPTEGTFEDFRFELPKRRRVYVSGKMRGMPELNFPAFDAARDFLTAQGWDVYTPADGDRKLGLSAATWKNTPEQIREAVKRDVDFLLSLRSEDGDAIALIPKRWTTSIGVLGEFFVARWLGLKCLNAETGKPFTKMEVARMSLWGILGSIRSYLKGEK